METKPFFLPWEGPNYRTSSPKILILGESHCRRDGSDQQTFTQGVIRSWAIGEEGTRKFFTTIAKVLSGKLYEHLSKSDKVDFWNRVALYNYIQEVVGDKPRDRPTDLMWEQAQQPFLQVIENLSPDIVVVLGGHLSHYINRVKDQCPTVHFCHWYHPSSFGAFKKHKARAAFDAVKQEWSAERK